MSMLSPHTPSLNAVVPHAGAAPSATARRLAGSLGST